MKKRTSFPAAFALVTSLVLPVCSWAENEIGFIEKFALAPDRAKVLGELVPGTEDYYFFHALHWQNTREAAKLADLLQQWKKRFPDSDQRQIIENREALLGYDANPQKTLAFLRDRLHLQFNHQQEVRDRKPDLPSTLDPKRIGREVFERDSIANDQGLGSLSEEALEALVKNKVALDEHRRRALLGRLKRPDVPGLLELIAADLKSKESRGFGEFAIHRALLPEQLDALAKQLPGLPQQQAFVFTKLRKLAPSADVDVEFDAAEREAWLERVWAYAKTLSPTFNTVKAHVLYLRLDHDRKKGVYDAARFLEYLKLPRSSGFVNPKWLERVRDTQPQWDVNANLAEALPQHRPIGDDEPLVRDYFLNIFQRAAAQNLGDIGAGMMAPYTDYVRNTWLKPVLAEALITSGQGHPEQWASLITPEEFQRLKDRVDIEFPSTNAPTFKPASGGPGAQGAQAGDDVQFDVTVKNTPKLIVKIYEVNALNFFLTQHRQLNTDLNLDGLVANSEQTHTFDTGPFKRTRQTFKFPALKGKRGAWIVEFIGGGRSSRALVRTGQWQVLQATGPSGDLLTVLDERGEQVKDAVAWLDGRKLVRDEKLGRIVVPFTAQPGMKQVVLADAEGTFATLAQFEHHAEAYVLDAHFHIEREQLLARHEATLAVRTALMLGEAHLDPTLLTEPKLTVTSVTHDGISTTREFKDLKLTAGGVLTHDISVPERLAQLTVTLTGKVDVLSAGGQKRDVSASHHWTLNGIEKTEATNDGHLSKFGGNYVFELLGRNGEPLADQQAVFTFKHREFGRTQNVALRTDEKGRVELGALGGIASFTAQIPNGRQSSWELDDFERTWPAVIHTGTAQPVRVPLPPRITDQLSKFGFLPKDWLQREVSLLEVKAGTFAADHGGQMEIADGFLVIKDLTPGDYALRLREEKRDIAIKVSGGKASSGWYLGAARNLQAKSESPLHITGVLEAPDAITVKLANTSPFTRVHVVASRFEPGRGIFGDFGNFVRFGAASATPARLPNLYAAGREIGDEYRYILDRRYQKLLPGNMLTRPGLLLNPWDKRSTDIEELAQQAGEMAGATAGAKPSSLRRANAEPVSKRKPGPGGAAAESNLDFLAAPAPAIYNFLPDKDGTVRIDRKILGDRQHVQIYAEDLANAEWRSFALPEAPTKFADQRLTRNLDPVKPFTQKKEITVVEQGRTLTLADILTSEFETYDTLGGVFSLLTTLNGDATLAKFAWVLEWPKLKDDEKRAKYSEFACHELNFFLARKDRAFFDKVVKPYLANKKDRTFMDDFLLENDLKPYLQPWAYARLNVVERALLAQRIPGEAAGAARHLREVWEMIPPNPDEQDRLFETALRGRALQADAGEAEGLHEFKREKAALALSANAIDSLLPGTTAAPAAAPASPLPMPELAPGIASPRGAAADAPHPVAGAKSAEHQLRLGVDKDMRDLAKAKNGRMLAERDELMKMPVADPEGRKAGVLATDALYFSETEAVRARGLVRAYYRQIGATKEWAENNYYRLPIEQQNGELVTVNAFWRDYAAWVGGGAKGAFVSGNVAEAGRNFTEMLLALAVLDLPFDAPKHTQKADGGQFHFTAGGAAIVYHKEIKQAAPAKADAGQLLVSQSFFRQDDRFRQEGNEKFEKYVTGEFLTGAVYGANVVVTNPTSSPVKAEVLLQIPKGALPVLGSKATDSRRLRLEPYTTKTFEYFFYFPAVAAGGAKFPHYPVNVAVAGSSAAAAKAFEFNVVAKLTQFDKASWDYVSQYGTDAEVHTFIEQNNIESLNLERIAWRCRQDVHFYCELIRRMQERHVWNDAIYSYSVVHNDTASLREWLRHRDDFLGACGPFLAAKLITIDPIERRAYEHLEYSPLVNQRAHRLGSERRIANPAVLAQYQSLLGILAHKPQLDAMDSMSVTYHLFLQDRVEEALARFHSIDANALPTRIQHDYFRCYADFYEDNVASARGIAANYSGHPVARWRNLFAEVASQLDEAEGKAAAKKDDDKPDREKQQAELAATEPSFDLKVENRNIALTWKNLGEVTINYYLMDPEFSFSSNPFVSQDAGRFSIIKPTQSAKQALPAGKDALDIPLPGEFAKANVLVEVVGAGQRKAQAYHANTLKLTLTENYGRIEARDSGSNKPVAKAYVKVYARLANGTVRFFKDGYTDLRGRFDYASLNAPEGADGGLPGNAAAPRGGSPDAPANGLDYQMLKPTELNRVEKLAILLLSDTHGAAVREVNPPRN
jgi:hypothetical protein